MPEQALQAYGHLRVGEQNGTGAFRITLRDAGGLYGVMDTLKAAGLRVLAVNKKEADLEAVFLHLTEGRGQPKGALAGD